MSETFNPGPTANPASNYGPLDDDGSATVASNGSDWRNLSILADIPLRLSVEVGSTSIRLMDAMDIAEGSIVELDRQSHELLDIMANGTLIAKGEVVTVNNRFGIRVVDIVPNDMRAGFKERRN